MMTTLLVALAAIVGGQPTAAAAAKVSPLAGTWSEVKGPGLARIGPCPDAPTLLCAMGLDRRAPGRPETGLVLTGIRPSGPAKWRGTYHDGSRRLPATIRFSGPQQVEMKVCLVVICQTATYARVK